MYVKKNTRVTFKSNRRHGHRRNNSFSNGKGRNKGNITQQYQKYLKLAKEASSSGDRIQSEYYYQFADHYSRLMLELGLFIDDNIENQNSEEMKFVGQQSENDNNSEEEIKIDKDKDKFLLNMKLLLDIGNSSVNWASEKESNFLSQGSFIYDKKNIEDMKLIEDIIY